jgi:hypothetical protein
MPASESLREKRSTRRVGIITQVECKAAGNVSLGYSHDISEGGLMLATRETLNCGTQVAIRLNLPPYPPGLNIEAQGLVSWVQTGEYMGVQFLQLAGHQQKAIAEFIELSGRITKLGPL